MHKPTPRVLYVVTDGMSVRALLRRQLAFLKSRGFELAVASNPGDGLYEVAEELGIRAYGVPMAREIAPLQDMKSLADLIMVIRDFRPDIVNAGTPKAGLLGTLAARLCNVRGRYYVVRGLRLETARGIKAAVLGLTERLASLSATRVICVSHSLRKEYRNRFVPSDAKLVVFGAGSSQGVDTERFDKRGFDKVSQRASLGMSLDEYVIGFVGRLTRDKGIVELVEAFSVVRSHVPTARLLLVGSFEEGDSLPSLLVEKIRKDPAIMLTGFVPDPRPYYSVMDVLAFPSHREGFPNAVLEAAAMELPTVAATATGSKDAVEDGVTGQLVEVGDVRQIASALVRYAVNPVQAQEHGVNARERANRLYNSDRLFQELASTYLEDWGSF